MAPSSGTLLIPVAMRLFRQAVQKTQALIRARLSEQSTRALGGKLQPIPIRNPPQHPLHRIAALRQSKGRWYTTHSSLNAAIRRFTTSSSAPTQRISRASFPSSTIGSAANRLTTRAPFASTLRPNLTGGAIPRTAGGYSTGAGRLSGGVRHFSHTPAAPAQVIQNVTTAMRAFLLSGQKAQFAGVDVRSGRPQYKAVTSLQSATSEKLHSLPKCSPGTSIDFAVTPTITALAPLSFPVVAQEQETLNTEGLLDVLSGDFARALKDLSLILSDLKRLSSLGDLDLSMPDKSTLRVHFPGCDHDTVERLCMEFDIQRGIIRQDVDFDESAGAETALLFPFAPSRSASDGGDMYFERDRVEWQTMLSTPGYSNRSETGTGSDFEKINLLPEEMSPREGYESMHPSDACSSEDGSDNGGRYFYPTATTFNPAMRSTASARDYEGLEGIHRFLAECDGARDLF